jgi:hypothetical protein
VLWSFNDNYIGKTDESKTVLFTCDIRRPTGFPRSQWYDFASQVCKLLNQEAKANGN